MEEKSSEEIAREILGKSKKVDTDQVVETARMVLLVVAGITFFNAVILWSSVNVRYVLLFQIVAFVILYFNSKNKPLQSFVIGLLLYVIPLGALSFWAYIVITLSLGFIVRLFIIAMLVWGIVISYKQKTKRSTSDELLDSSN